MADNLDKNAAKQRESIRLEKEYQEALKMSSSLSNQITSALSSQVDFRTKLGKKVKEYYKDLESNISNLESSDDIAKELLRIEEEKAKVSKNYFGTNEKVGKQKLQALSITEESLKVEQGRVGAIEEVAKRTEAFTDSLGSGLDSALSGFDAIPGIGSSLKNMAQGPINGLKSSFKEVGKSFTTNFATNLRGGAGMMKSLQMAGGIAGKGLIAALTGPQAIIALIVAGIAVGIARFVAIEAAAKKFREETGLLNSQMGNLKKDINSVSTSMADLGVDASDVAGAAAAFSNEMKGTSMASKGVLTSMVAMEKSFGVSAATQAKVNNTFQLMSGASDTTAQKMIQTTIAAAELAGVAPAAVMQDIAENAEAGLMHFRGSTKALANAAIEARRMGTSIGETTKVAEGLLDFESSITKELELGAMLGTRVNFNKARALAFEGKTVEAQKAVNAEVSKLGDINKMNMYQKQALMGATNMDLKSLIKQQSIAKKFKGIDGDRLAAVNSLLDAGMSIEAISDKALENEAKKLGAQKAMQSETDKMGNTFSALGTAVSDMFMPLGTFLMPLLSDVFEMVNNVLLPVFSMIGTVLRIAFGVLSAVLRPVFALIKTLAAALMEPFRAISEAIRPIGDKFEEIGPRILKAMAPVLSFIKVLGKVIGEIVGFVVGGLVDGFIFAFDIIFSIFEGAYNFVDTYLISPLMSMIDMIQTGIDALASLNPFGSSDDELVSEASQLQSGGSIDDGIVQDGKIISTHPEDTLIATKTPESLFNESTGGGVSNVVGGIGEMMGGLFGGDSGDSQIGTKLDELIIVMKANKDFYIDGKKVTASVSSTVDKIGSNSYAIV